MQWQLRKVQNQAPLPCKAGSEKRLDVLERLHFEDLSQTEQRGLLSCSFTELSSRPLVATIENTWSYLSGHKNPDAGFYLQIE